MPRIHSRLPRQFGDFQTPLSLARSCSEVLAQRFASFDTIVEPTCGRGHFLVAASEVYPQSVLRGYEQDARYVRIATDSLVGVSSDVQVRQQDFFVANWQALRDAWGQRVLFLGNPPWVTNAQLGKLDATNLPSKRNIDRVHGIEAITGGANFDLAESVLRTLIVAMRPRQDVLAMLVKSSTVRRVIERAWKAGQRFGDLRFYRIDAARHFDATVEAGWLVLQLDDQQSSSDQQWQIFDDLQSSTSNSCMGLIEGHFVRDFDQAKATEHLASQQPTVWRSGVKHDAASVLELTQHNGLLLNASGTHVDIEADCLFPLAKGSDVAAGTIEGLSRKVLIPQTRLDQSTSGLIDAAPKTYGYLCEHQAKFAARRSTIYRGRDRFAVFGLGDYTFAPWKIAISGLSKRLRFTLYGPVEGKPVVFDDTVYLLPFSTQASAELALKLLVSEPATQFLESRIFWDAKRPIHAKLLRRLCLVRLAEQLDLADSFARLIGARSLRRAN